MKTSAVPSRQAGIIFIFLMLFFMFALSGYAQKKKFNVRQSYFGIELMGGCRNAGDQHEVGGGTIGLVTGKDFMMLSIKGIGIFQKGLKPQTNMSLFESQVSVNMMLLKMLGVGKSPIDLYPLVGASFGRYDFGAEDVGHTSLNTTTAFNSMSYSLGGGMVIKLKNRFQFFHLFAEVANQQNINADACATQCGLGENISANIGLRIGRIFNK